MNARDAHRLGTSEELPAEYREALTAAQLVPLWPHMRDALPYDAPRTRTVPTLWAWSKVRPLLLRAGELTPMDKAERRVLVLSNPGRGLEQLQATSAMFLGMQLVLPGEVAPNHRHSPNAVRIVIEGEGGYTVVEGARCPMEHGDLVLTPSTLWHEHHHEGKGPLIWLDVLDLPVALALEVSYAISGAPQAQRPFQSRYAGGGLVPVVHGHRDRSRYPVMRYEWRRTQSALEALAAGSDRGTPAILAYVNPETGEDCMNTVAYSALMVRPGEEVKLPRISPSRVLHVVEGAGDAEISGVSMSFERSDTFCAPGLARVRLANRSARAPLFLVIADESPVHRKLGYYEERPE